MFFYYEDVDLSLRLRDAGWKLIYNPNAVVYHDHQATSKRLHTTFNMNFKANLNRIKSISRRFGIIAAALEAVRTLFEWIYCKISGKSLKDKVLDNIKKRRNAK
jgi:GT2 family glycosyltransferase